MLLSIAMISTSCRLVALSRANFFFLIRTSCGACNVTRVKLSINLKKKNARQHRKTLDRRKVFLIFFQLAFVYLIKICVFICAADL
jgi:hypothetical protein